MKGTLLDLNGHVCKYATASLTRPLGPPRVNKQMISRSSGKQPCKDNEPRDNPRTGNNSWFICFVHNIMLIQHERRNVASSVKTQVVMCFLMYRLFVFLTLWVANNFMPTTKPPKRIIACCPRWGCKLPWHEEFAITQQGIQIPWLIDFQKQNIGLACPNPFCKSLIIRNKHMRAWRGPCDLATASTRLRKK